MAELIICPDWAVVDNHIWYFCNLNDFGGGGQHVWFRSITSVMFRWWLTPKQNWTSWSLSGTPPLFRFSWDFSSDSNIFPGWPDDNGYSEARSHFRHFWLQACKCLLPHLWQRGSLIFHHSDQIFYLSCHIDIATLKTKSDFESYCILGGSPRGQNPVQGCFTGVTYIHHPTNMF